MLRQYKPAAFLKAQQAARAAAAAAGTPAADPTPLRTLRLGRLLEEVQVGAAAFGASWWCCNMAKIESLVAPKHAAVAALEVGTRSSPAPAPNTHRHHPALRCPPPKVLRDCKHFIKVGSGEPTRRLRHWYQDEDAAKEAAQAELDKRIRGEHKLTLTMPGNPAMGAESPLLATGFRAGIDGEWLITRVAHSLSKGTGYVCDIEAEKAKAETETEEESTA